MTQITICMLNDIYRSFVLSSTKTLNIFLLSIFKFLHIYNMYDISYLVKSRSQNCKCTFMFSKLRVKRTIICTIIHFNFLYMFIFYLKAIQSPLLLQGCREIPVSCRKSFFCISVESCEGLKRVGEWILQQKEKTWWWLCDKTRMSSMDHWMPRDPQ